MEIIDLAPKASENGISPIVFRIVVLYAQRILDISSVHALFLALSLFFRQLRTVLLEALAWPSRGYWGEEVRWKMPSSLYISVTTELMN